MSKNFLLILFWIIEIIQCSNNKNDTDISETLIKENKTYYYLYILIFVFSIIIGICILFFFNEKTEEKENIKISNTTECDNLNAPTNNNDLGSYDEDESNNQNTEKIKGCEKILYNFSFLSRIIFTFLSLEALFFIYNMIIQDILIFPGILFDMKKKIWIFFYLLYFIFIWLVSKLIIIPTYEFLNFSFLRYYNPFCHLNSFRYLINGIEYKEIKKEKLSTKYIFRINLILVILGVFFITSFVVSFFRKISFIKKDYLEFCFLIMIFIYYISIIFCYFLFSLYYCYKIVQHFITNKKCNLENFNISDNYPSLNLVYYNINPYIEENYEESEQKNKRCYYTEIIIRIVLKSYFFLFSIIAIIYFIIYNNKQNLDTGYLAFFIALNIFIIIFSLLIRFPFCYKGKYKKEVSNIPLFISRFIGFLVFVSCLIAFIYISSLKEYENDDVYSKILKINTTSTKKVEVHRNKTMHSFCYSGIHNMPIYLFIPFINDAYYYDENKTTFKNEKYTKLFYNDDYKIESIGNLINNTDRGDKKMSKMIQYNVLNKKNEMTILSIKGTSFRRDWYLDIQLYFPAILLNLINTFSTLDQQKEEKAFSFVEYGFSIPYRILFKYFIIDQYLYDLIKAFEKYNSTFNKNVIIVGHSLGGGLAKIMGKYKSKQALSLSGPGMNSFHSLWKYEGISEYFDLTSIDIIPDLDLVPRVDISGGTVYRLLCLNWAIKCHSKELSLCESMIMCRNPNAREYCYNIAKISYEDIDKLYNATEFDEKSLIKKL